jgi:hypothetical protein
MIPLYESSSQKVQLWKEINRHIEKISNQKSPIPGLEFWPIPKKLHVFLFNFENLRRFEQIFVFLLDLFDGFLEHFHFAVD